MAKKTLKDFMRVTYKKQDSKNFYPAPPTKPKKKGNKFAAKKTKNAKG